MIRGVWDFARRFVAGAFLIVVAGTILAFSIGLVPALQLRLSDGGVDLYPEALRLVLTRHGLERDQALLKEEYARLDRVYAANRGELDELQRRTDLIFKVISIYKTDYGTANGGDLTQNLFEQDRLVALKKLERSLVEQRTSLLGEITQKASDLNNLYPFSVISSRLSR